LAEIAKAIRFVIINEDSDYGRIAAVAFREKIKKLHPDVDIVEEFSVKPPGGPDFTSYINRIIEARPDAVYAALKGQDMAFFFNQGMPKFKEKKIPIISKIDLEEIQIGL